MCQCVNNTEGIYIRTSEFHMKVGPPMRNPFLANSGLEIFHINEWRPAYLIQLVTELPTSLSSRHTERGDFVDHQRCR